MSFGIIFSPIISLTAFAEGGNMQTSEVRASNIPSTLDECCIELDKIFTQEEKNKIKQSSVYNVRSYLNEIRCGRIGIMITHNWLYLPPEEGEAGRKHQSKLAKLLLAHGAGFEGDEDCVMLSIILENYSHYLNGNRVESIEDLVVDHWFNFWRYFNSDLKREEFQNKMERWTQARDSRKTQIRWSCCTIL